MLGIFLWFSSTSPACTPPSPGCCWFTIPTRTRLDAIEFSATARELLEEFERTETGDYLTITSQGQQEAIGGLERASELVTAPLLRLEHHLHGLAAFVVIPLLAFSNAGVTLSGSAAGPVTLAVALGLVLGKPLGITAASLAAVRLRLTALPHGVMWTALHGCAWLGGLGFTMSLFIATLAFDGTPLLDAAKVGIFGGSVRAGTIGAFIVRSSLDATAQRA